MNKKLLIITVIVLFSGAAILFLLDNAREHQVKIKEGAEKEDKTWITNRGETDIIKLFSPEEGEIVEPPLIITGQARGFWFFEADFPVLLVNWDGLIIAETYAQAQDDWMTDDYVPFEAEFVFENPVFPEAEEEHFSRRGYLILQKANPSGFPEYDDALEISVKFK